MFCTAALVRLTMAAINQMPAWIWGKMTAVLQITDTDVAHHLKRFANEAQHALRRELREKARAEGTHACFKQGIYEILRVTSEALAKLRRYMDIEAPRTLQAGLRNYLLSYRPDYATKTLVKAVEQPWAQGFSEGNHRIRAEWAQDRYNWLDENGIPSCLPWEGLGAAVTALEDMEEHSYHGPEGSKVALTSWEDTEAPDAEEVSVSLDLALTAQEEIKEFSEAAAHLMDRVKGKASATGEYYDKFLSSQTVRGKKAKKKAERDAEHRAANAENLEELQKRLKVASRREVLDSIVPQVGPAKALSKGEVKTKLKSVLSQFAKSARPSTTRLSSKTSVPEPGGSALPPPPPLERRVRVTVQSSGYKRLYGREATETTRDEVTGMSTLKIENVFHTVEIPSKFLSFSEKFLASRPLWNAQNKTRLEKQMVLELASVVDPVRDSRIERVTKDTPTELSAAHVDVWAAILETTFDAEGYKYFIVRPDTSLTIATLMKQGSSISDEEAPALYRLQVFLSKVLLRYDLTLLPLRNVSMKGGHFTLLSVVKDGMTYKWRYRDSLSTLCKGTLETAELLVRTMRLVLPADATVQGPELWPSRENVAMQAGLECAAHVCHYLEEEVRMAFQDDLRFSSSSFTFSQVFSDSLRFS